MYNQALKPQRNGSNNRGSRPGASSGRPQRSSSGGFSGNSGSPFKNRSKGGAFGGGERNNRYEKSTGHYKQVYSNDSSRSESSDHSRSSDFSVGHRPERSQEQNGNPFRKARPEYTSRQQSGNDRVFDGNRSKRPSYNDRSSRDSFGGRNSYNERPSNSERSVNNDRPSYNARPARQYSDVGRSSFGGGERSSGGNRSAGRHTSFGGDRSRLGGRGGRGRGGRSSFFDLSVFVNKGNNKPTQEEFYKPQHSFNDFDINSTLKQIVTGRGYKEPTPIQDQTIEHVLNGEDIVGLANTGTGKTAAFLIPLINKILANKDESVLVMTPTRELAIQIEEELKSFSRNLKIYSVVCVGGVGIRDQITKLRQHNHFVIGTPGRIMDLMKRGNLKLGNTHTVVLDEADRMLDMGFVDDMRYILNAVPKDRQTLCFSATMSPEINSIVKDFLKTPKTISVKTRDTAENVEQDIVRLMGKEKDMVLTEMLMQREFTKVLIFGKTKHGVEKLSKVLVQRGIRSVSIHGNKSHGQRQLALRSFKESRVQVMVATDVAARGLDISNVSHVINYELPATREDYVHRIGRTGRGAQKGKALTFID